MRNWLWLFLFLFGSSAFAQLAAYQSFEVDSVAKPRGGVVFFNTFVQTNLRKPIQAEAQGLGGRVILEGIVEPNGHIAEVRVIQKFRPDCDREAIRVFNQFNAWQPAQKNGQAVRQRVAMPIIFQPNQPFIIANGARVSFFGSDNNSVTDSSHAPYRQIAPMDTNGLPTGDIVLYKRKGTSWKEDLRMPLVHKLNAPRSPSAKPTQFIGYQNDKHGWEGQLLILDGTGARVRQEHYQNGQRVGPILSYHENGSVSEKIDDFDKKQTITSWYSTGQIRYIRTVPKSDPLGPNKPEQVVGFWDSTGHQQINEGNGPAVYQTKTTSRSDTTRETQLTERGYYTNGFKQGIWTGHYDDGSYFYEEHYDKGICTGGKACRIGADTVRYTDLGQQPEFMGGMQGLGQFLSQHLSYPISAQKAGAQGRVFVSFVVCTDGTLCDYEVLKGVQRDLDREAVRVIQKMSGKWKPGEQRGEKVRVKYNLPIDFSMQ